MAFTLLAWVSAAGATSPQGDGAPLLLPDSLELRGDTLTLREATRPSTKGWVDSLIASGFRINSPSIHYPKVAKWMVGVYNWGDRLFNSYDSLYVVGTGKNWKALFTNDTWMRTYVMHFSDNSLLHISSHLYDDVGLKLCFMAVNIGYNWNVNTLIGQKTERKTFDLSFTCSKFAASYVHRSAKGNSTIRKFGDYNGGHRLDVEFNDIEVDDTHFDIYYFFNNKRYSQASAYCFSKYQLKSAGSWLLGFSYARQRLGMDFSSLPQEMLDALPTLQRNYQFHNTDYNVLGGYAYNKVLKPRKWLLNITLLPSIGYKHTSQNERRSIRDMLSTNMEGMASMVYNHRLLFLTVQGRFCGYVNYSKDYTFFNSTNQLIASVGVRF